ncbi:MAG: hypothetical protein IJQ73_01395 [Kiritimatiellae bacterium]|nr:hypothetical protein [Kiritimatiellia bacterium]
MPKLPAPMIIIASLLLFAQSGRANDESPYTIVELSLLPHQAGICDLIFTGTAIDGTTVSNSEECAADFLVDEVLWGHHNSTIINVRSLPQELTSHAYPFTFVSGERYLVCAFTNNWWAGESQDDTYDQRLCNYLSVTSSPPGNAVFDGYRTMLPRFTAIPFSKINCDGSNYWPVTRALVTNLVDIARVRGDEQLMRHTITSLVEIGWAKSGLPEVIWNQLWRYKTDRFSWNNTPGNGQLQAP